MFSNSSKTKVYLASGWFNDEQMKQMNEVYDALYNLEKSGKIEFFSPYYNGILLKKEDPNLRKKIQIIWWLNIGMLKVSDIVIVCTQDNDAGTLFEAGIASTWKKTIFCFNSNKELNLSLMLVQVAKGFLKKTEDINDAIHKYSQTPILERDQFVYNDFQGEPI